MNAPKEVMELLEEIDRRATARYNAEYRRQQLERERLRRIQDLKLARYDEVWGYARFLFQWLGDFLQTPEARRIWEVVGKEGRLPIFTAKFWRGEPCPPEDRTTWATLALDGWCHHLRYEEWHKGQRSFRSQRLTSCQEIFDALHPEFLKQLQTHLTGPDAWKYIIKELRKRS